MLKREQHTRMDRVSSKANTRTKIQAKNRNRHWHGRGQRANEPTRSLLRGVTQRVAIDEVVSGSNVTVMKQG